MQPKKLTAGPARFWLAAGRVSSAGSHGGKPHRVVEGNVCWFCLRPNDASVPGGLARLHSVETSKSQPLAIKYHEACVGYSNTDPVRGW